MEQDVALLQKADIRDKRVVIIGAGLSGVKLAHMLAKEGVKFVMLEASDHIGGRMKHIEFGGKTLETGPMWV